MKKSLIPMASIQIQICQLEFYSLILYDIIFEILNFISLHMYGFVETFPNNNFDSVEIPLNTFVLCSKNHFHVLIEKKIEILKQIDLLDENFGFVISMDGVLNEEELLHTLQVCFCFFKFSLTKY